MAEPLDATEHALVVEAILLLDHVERGGELLQVRERRGEYADRRFYYKAIVAVPGLLRGLFIEIILVDDDVDCPAVLIVNAHEQKG